MVQGLYRKAYRCSAGQEGLCYHEPSVGYRVYKIPPLHHVLKQCNMVYTVTHSLFKIHFNAAFPSTSMSPKWSLPVAH
jgi:hypothetical protein